MKSHPLAPIVLFVYNRPWHTQQTIEALQNNELASESELFIYADGAKNNKANEGVKKVRNYIKTVDGFSKVTIIERENNLGLADSIIDGVTQTVNKYGRVIVLEDDLVTSSYFLRFMNDALEVYKYNNEVASIHGYLYPIDNMIGVPDTFFIKGADCWGWATWARSWELFELNGQKLLDELQYKKLQKEADFNNSYGYSRMLKDQINGKNNSWAIRWYMSCFLQNKLTLYPKRSYVQNIGNDDSGTHCSQTDQFFIDVLSHEPMQLNKVAVVSEDANAREYMEKYFRRVKQNLLTKIFKKIKQSVVR
ncbi:glycosyltransferase [uncultured Paraglaciecola sp.]|uniref:glycosyltransferase n=1 Tax=uncultured Paraglaciecola sp. TaxID=1765024 RepID=UPI0025F39CB2|nr:glycosyltransferase [uncultured Paraglaciecola sp.]